MQMKTPLGWSKSGRLVGNNKANISSDLKMRSVNTKANNTLDSMGSSNSSGSSVASGSSRLEDSALLISPPNQVTFADETPRPYFLRGQPKFSSTPLLIPNNENKGNQLVGTNLEDRLHSLEEHKSLSDDSGFDTLPSTESPSPCTSSSSTHPSSPPPRALGALPKRRSPRNISKNQSSKGKVDKPSSFVNFTSSASSFPPSQKRALFKYEPRQHLDGKETCDMVRMLFEMNLSHVLSAVFQYCGGSQLCAIAQVSQLWNLSLVTSTEHNDRRLKWIALRKRNQENNGIAVTSRLGLPSPRRVMQQLDNQPIHGGIINIDGSNSGGKRGRAASVAAIVSPSKVRHRLFVDEAQRLSPGEHLTHCPLCTSPSRVSGSRAECSSNKCSFVFCPDCLCEHHEGRGCRLTRTGSKVPKSGTVSSKKSKARLRRL